MSALPAPVPDAPASAPDRVDVSVLIPVLNEERHIRETVAAMQGQRFDGTLELLFADGRSTDRTREILLELAALDPRIRLLDNPRRGTASGLNVCLRESRGEFVARMDAHTFYADRYLAAGVERLRRGDTEWVSGPMIPRPVGPISRAVALAVGSWLGRGSSRKWSHNPDAPEECDLDTGVFCGVWRRARVLEAGGWDERWPINQDSEMAARFLKRGARLVSVPEMAGHYVPRDSLPRLVRQYYRYGFYRARTFQRHPLSMRRSHLLPPALALSVMAAVAGPRPLRGGSRAGLAFYATVVAATGVNAATRKGARADGALLLAVIPAMHLGWGFGTLAGMARFGPPIAAIAQLVRGGDWQEGAGEKEPVYAPSLHAENS